jgi:hypothetical protein
MDTLKQFIGIDPSFREKGFAICIIGGGEAVFKVFKGFIEFVQWLDNYKKANDYFEGLYLDIKFCIENSNLTNATFDMRGNKNVIAKVSRDAGKNQAISQITTDYCRLLFPDAVTEVSPIQKGAKIDNDVIFRAIAKDAKITLTNYKGQVGEQDKRDAFMLALKIYK